MNGKGHVKRMLIVCAMLCPTVTVLATVKSKPVLLREGFILKSVPGTVIHDQNDTWLFKLAVDVNDYRVTVKAGTTLQLLPSSILEKIAANTLLHTEATYELWARVTKYKDANYIYPISFLPVTGVVSRPQQGNPPTGQAGQSSQPTEPVPSESENFLEIPDEVLQQLNSSEITQPKILKTPAGQNTPAVQSPAAADGSRGLAQQKNDAMLADRTAFLERNADGSYRFVLDALGRNLGRGALKLLPCEILELTEQRTAGSSERWRFKIAGIQTTYKGQPYLLLQKATRVYSHGNFRAFTSLGQ